jgi:SAM-dependent methyltransferase
MNRERNEYLFDKLIYKLTSLFSYNEKLFSNYLNGAGVEIGALDNPMKVPYGAKVLYVDHLNKCSLRKHYPEMKHVDIVDVDVVASVETLDSTFPLESLDFVIANHIIEHLSDPLGALKQFHRVLRVGGILHLAVPDRRATFDRDRPRTLLSHCIQDHEVSSEMQRAERDILHYKEWVAKVPKYYSREQRDYQSNFGQLWEDRYSIHLHVWEPNDWPEIINYLGKINHPYSLLDFSNVFCSEQRNEFVIILRKEDISVQPIQNTLPEKGPFRWYFTRTLIRIFIRPLKPFLRPIIHSWLRRQNGR